MAGFINHNSFLLTVLLLEALAAWLILRKGVSRRRWLALGAATLLLGLVFYTLRPSSSTDAAASAVRARIGQGTPVLLEFKSPN